LKGCAKIIGMVIGACLIEMNLPGLGSLKEKRSVLKSLIARIHKEFNVTAAEVDLHDAWQATTLGVATISTSAVHAQNLLNNLVSWIESYRPDLEVVDHYVELIPFSSGAGN
jgi:uncharacterized protein YlxP (DUF503 family)